MSPLHSLPVLEAVLFPVHDFPCVLTAYPPLVTTLCHRPSSSPRLLAPSPSVPEETCNLSYLRGGLSSACLGLL